MVKVGNKEDDIIRLHRELSRTAAHKDALLHFNGDLTPLSRLGGKAQKGDYYDK